MQGALCTPMQCQRQALVSRPSASQLGLPPSLCLRRPPRAYPSPIDRRSPHYRPVACSSASTLGGTNGSTYPFTDAGLASAQAAFETATSATATAQEPHDEDSSPNSRRRYRTEELYEGALSRMGAPIWPRGNLTAVVLGGGEADSRRLFPLTQRRTLPAIPFGGSYRLIDLLMSNLLNSGVNKVHILTAYNSYSMNRHLQKTYDMSGGVPYGGDGYMEVVAAAQSPENQQWVTGTAGVVRQFMSYFDSNSKNHFIEDVLILPSDHVYVTDLTPVISYHRATGADLTIVCRPVSGEQATRLGVVKLDSEMRIRSFREKPRPDQLADLAMSDDEMRPFLDADHHRHHQHSEQAGCCLGEEDCLGELGWGAAGSGGGGGSGQEGSESDGLAAARALWAARGAGAPVVLDTMASADDGESGPTAPGFVGSTGIYIFRRSVLSEALARHKKANDFGRQLIPELIREGCKVYGYRLPGYWADVGGSVGEFFAANMALLGDNPSINFDTPLNRPLFRHPLTIPATQLHDARVTRSLVSSGCRITGATLRSTVVGPRTVIGPGVEVTDSVVMGADHYEHERPQQRPLSATYPPLGIGEGSVIRGAMLDLNCRVGRGVSLVNREGVYESYDRAVQGMYIRDGVIVLARDTVVPDGTVL